MNEELKSLGEEIARQRQEKGMTIAQLSARTKITEGFLEKLEQGDFGFLPVVYIRAFIRAVAAEIGLDPEVMMRRFDNARGTAVPDRSTAETAAQPAPDKPFAPPAEKSLRLEPEERREPDDTGRFKSPFTLGLMLLALLALLYVFFSHKPSKEPNPMDAGISVVAPTAENQPLRDAPLVPVDEHNKVDSTAVSRLMLTLKSEETAWVRIVYQDSLVEEGVFTEGLSRSWISPEKFYLKIGNAGGIRLALDGQDLGYPGKKGQVVTIVVTKEGVAPLDPTAAPALLTRMQP
ncbi:MAG TPA: helix-turn-helix domain-containing protein [bacterium]|nr:helix-turn-helix domain-containing protein [bacterium]HQI47779.1 helix-turn-helix domain-containing protein [bacterium]HQJ63209.1 helix-turn-helix domain-containing protein [bacterium]